MNQILNSLHNLWMTIYNGAHFLYDFVTQEIVISDTIPIFPDGFSFTVLGLFFSGYLAIVIVYGIVKFFT